MAITFDASANGNTGVVTPETTLTFAHTVGSGSNRALFVFVAFATPTSVTFNGVNMTLALSASETYSASTYPGSLWFLPNPASGTHNVVVTLASSNFFCAASASFFGVSLPAWDVWKTGGFLASPGSLSVATLAANDLVLSGILEYSNAASNPLVAPTGFTSAQKVTLGTGYYLSLDYVIVSGTATESPSYADSNTHAMAMIVAAAGPQPSSAGGAVGYGGFGL